MNIGSLFGKKPAAKSNNNTQEKAMQAIQDLSGKIGDLEEKIKYIETKKNNLNEQAKTKLKAGDKNGARQALAKKKKYDEQIKQFDGAIMMMEEQKMMLENADSMKSIFESVQKANSALVESQKGMSVEDLEKLREQMEDMKDTQKEMTEFFESYATTEDEDVENELEELASQLDGEKAKDELPEIGKSKLYYF
jgi:charged multivesicular body protein 4